MSFPLALSLTDGLLAGLVALIALLYSAAGQAGGTGFLAAMALFGHQPELMKATALTLNILVSAVGTWKYARAGRFSWTELWPYVLASLPTAFIGGCLHLPPVVYRPLVGVVLLYAAWRLLTSASRAEAPARQDPALWLRLLVGALIGLLSGLTGVGGGIFLSPLLLLLGWADPKVVPGMSAAFILVNSIAGLAGHLSAVAAFPPSILLWAAAAVLGGYLGATYGSSRLSPRGIQRLLAVILAVAAIRLLMP